MANAETGPCEIVGSGGVGESGDARRLDHRVTGEIQSIILLETTKSNLCPNTGVWAQLLVDGDPRTNGRLDRDPQAITTTADPGQWVSALVHTFPLNNGIECVVLGELEFVLKQCVPVT